MIRTWWWRVRDGATITTIYGQTLIMTRRPLTPARVARLRRVAASVTTHTASDDER